MKRALLLFFCLAAMGAGWFLSQPQGAALLRASEIKKLQATASRVQNTATNIIQTRVAAAQSQLAKEVEPPAPELAKWENLLCELANAERRKRGLGLMQIDEKLAAVARAHSRDMMQKKYFSHTSPTQGRRTTLDRYRAQFKDTPQLVAENIYTLQARGPRRLTEADIRRAHEGWMKSPGHRANILRTSPLSPGRIGVGIMVRGGSFWATQNFSTPF
jgi:uncharacterized protein YkwD